MNRSFAQVLSVVFHPLLLPTYLFAVILFYLPEPLLGLSYQGRWIILGMLFFTTFIIPGLGAYTMVRAGQLDSMEMDRREQRGLPLLFTGMCYAVTAYLLHHEQAFDAIFYFVMTIMAASVFLTYLVSLFWKISAHAIGMGGGFGLLLAMNRLMPDAGLLPPIVVVLFLSGAVLSARLALHKHTPAQVYSGFASGMLLALVAALTASL
ncbi:hypothetical protein [Pontibacter chitinilyticus]|uniref:hypothetical protein n=1 Tax=Pontibacter chitinilyticus TaxID=2674989 RepID=UPI003218F1F5